MPKYDVLIVGGGIVGTAIFETLTHAGMTALLIDSQRIGFGATGYSGAMVRLSHSDPASIAAAGLGLARYSKFAQETNDRVRLTTCGHLYFAQPDVLGQILPSVQACSPEARILSRDEIANRFAGMEVAAEAALYEPDAGFGDPVAFANHQGKRGIAQGGEIAEATALTHLIIDDGAVVGAQTSQGRLDCRHVVLALGAQAPQVLDQHGFTTSGLWSQKIQVSQFHLREHSEHWPGFVDETLGVNGLPGKGKGLYYVGLPTGEKGEPTTEARQGTLAHSERTRATAQTRLPLLAHGRPQGSMCHPDCYSNEPIAHIGQLKDGPDGLCLATGFSGGGFKMAPFAAQQILETLA